MKELTIEDKAKRYDEAIEVARKIKNGEPIDVPDGTPIPVAIFPELAESEDENIKNTVFDCLYRCCDSGVITREQRYKCIAWLEKQGEQFLANSAKTCKDEQNPAWSEEDENWLFNAINVCKLSNYNETADWLKSLKERVQPQPKQEWSEEDEEIRKSIIDRIERRRMSSVGSESAICENQIEWLKSLKGRYTWKPSEEQMNALREAIIEMGKSASCCNIEEFHEIQSLFCNLKKLTE